MYSKLKNTRVGSFMLFGCRCVGLLKLVRVFMLLAVPLTGFGPLIGIWIPVTVELSSANRVAVMHKQIHKGVFNYTHPQRHTHSELKVLYSDAALPQLLSAHRNQT